MARRSIPIEEIQERLLYPLINEGARILEEGIAERASDIDLIWINGYGFPLWRGGPLFYADTVGLGVIAERLDHYASLSGDKRLKPTTLLRSLAIAGKGFGDIAAAAKPECHGVPVLGALLSTGHHSRLRAAARDACQSARCRARAGVSQRLAKDVCW